MLGLVPNAVKVAEWPPPSYRDDQTNFRVMCISTYTSPAAATPSGSGSGNAGDGGDGGDGSGGGQRKGGVHQIIGLVVACSDGVVRVMRYDSENAKRFLQVDQKE